MQVFGELIRGRLVGVTIPTDPSQADENVEVRVGEYVGGMERNYPA